MDFICKIVLDELTPAVWRRFQFHSEITFHQLHQLLQTVMGWDDYHSYEFVFGSNVIGIPNPDVGLIGTRKQLNARKEQVGSHLKQEGAVFTYTYDFGDDWRHTITVENIATSNDSGSAPVCLAGERCCPPEDVGGVGGYEQLLEVLSTPNHPEREQLDEWLPEGYDPERFDLDETNRELRSQKNKLMPKPARQPKESKAAKEAKKPVKLTKSALNKHLKHMSQEQLIELVKDCYGVSKDIERFLAVRILGEEAVESLFSEYRNKVEQEFFPQRGTGKLRLQEAKQAIAEFERLTGNGKYSLELKLIYVEMGVSFTNVYGDIDGRFYNSMLQMYAEVIRMAGTDDTGKLIEEYDERIAAIVADTVGIGWGFHDVLAELYEQIR